MIDPIKNEAIPRRRFIKKTGAFAAVGLLGSLPSLATILAPVVSVDAHLWVYASRYPPDWNCTPILDQVFRELRSAGYAKVEIMESILRQEDSVSRLRKLIDIHQLPVGGSSYYGDLWDKEQQAHILEDIRKVIEKLRAVGATMIGLTVGDAEHIKTEQELDVQADSIRKIRGICRDNGIEPNLHNHTFEVSNGLHDLKGTLERIPDMQLGPDLNWLLRAGVDPVWFIQTYGRQMVYMHLRDQDAQGHWTEALGEGVMDFPGIAKSLKAIGYKGRAAVELAFDKPPVRPVEEDWRRSRQYVEKVFGW